MRKTERRLELAHFVKEHSTTVDINVTGWDRFAESGASPIEESQANIYAAELLMPSNWLETDFRAKNGDHEALAIPFME